MSAFEGFSQVCKLIKKNDDINNKRTVELIYKAIFDYECSLEDGIRMRNFLAKALLALEKQKNGLKCIGCGSIPKLKLCCNSCYQRLKLKEKRQVELIEWLEKEIESTGNRLKNAQLNGNSKRQTTSMTRIKALREVLERVGE